MKMLRNRLFVEQERGPMRRSVTTGIRSSIVLGIVTLIVATPSFARDISYDEKSSDVVIRVTPGEPTQIQFPGAIAGGYRKKVSALSLEPKDNELVVFSNEGLPENGEAILVRLKDGRSYSLRVSRSAADKPRDDLITILDSRSSILGVEEEEPAYREKKFDYAPPSQVSGFMREMVLAAEFGKASIPGYRVSESYRGQTVINDGTLIATVDKIFIGSNLWGYVIDAQNLTETSQKINPAAFRIDGTRAVSAANWELAPIPLTAEQQIAGKHKAKVYVVAKARR
jgi:hypothetical protein